MGCGDNGYPGSEYTDSVNVNNEAGAKLLCRMLTSQLENGNTSLSIEMLEWYIEHQNLNLVSESMSRTTDPSVYSYTQRELLKNIYAARRDLEKRRG